MYVVVMAGGSGTRFWPRSRKDRPKQFLSISGREPMVVETCNRLGPVARDGEMILVLGREHLHQARALLSGREVHIVAEPVGRNTAPCIGLGAIYAQYLGCRGPVAFLPADHFIAKPEAFLDSLIRAAEIAESGAIATLGIMPTRPETGYGYIRRGDAGPDPEGNSAYRVSAFVEKPDMEKALQYLACGDYYWNAGIFVAGPDTILDSFRRYLPGLHEGLMRLKGKLGKEGFETELEGVYDRIEGISFDYGVMERTESPVFVVPCECGWSDVGSWESLYDLRAQDRDGEGNLSEGENVLIDCRGSFVSGGGERLIACLGLRDCLVVDTPEALLVADIKRSQDIRKIIEHLKRAGKDRLL